MVRKAKSIWTICRRNPCDSDVWCPSCYVDFAQANGVFGQDAIEEFKKKNKKIDLTPRIYEPKNT